MVQYWRTFEHLSVYSSDRDKAHFPAWVEFNKRIAKSGDVGIFHETYFVRDGEYETIYSNMPPTGLDKCVERLSRSREIWKPPQQGRKGPDR